MALYALLGQLVIIGCAAATVVFLLLAESSIIWKIVIALVYSFSWKTELFIQTRFPIGFLTQIGLSIYYILYYKWFRVRVK
ncbi:MAG: hypothetical protein HY811_07675 [Planctomycetes bacterium]|nr:hypothetical protein [Planctomycetota bacterium]